MTEPTPAARPRPGPRPLPTSQPAESPPPSRRSRLERRHAERTAEHAVRLRRRGIAVAGLLLLVVAGLVVLLVLRAGDDSSAPPADPAPTAAFADPHLVAAYLAGAKSDIAAVTSYDYRDLGRALSAGSAVTTGAYRTSYRAALTGSVGAAAKRDHTVQTFDLIKAGIGKLSQDGSQAKVLIFGQENITQGSGADAAVRTVPATLTATMVRRGDTYLIGALESGANAGLPPATAQVPIAAEAGREEVINLLSYRSAHFDADYERALHGAAEPLRSEIAGNADATRASIEAGNYDLSGAVTAIAVERADGDTVTLLVVASSTKTDQAGTVTDTSDARYEVTVVHVSHNWITSDVVPVSSS